MPITVAPARPAAREQELARLGRRRLLLTLLLTALVVGLAAWFGRLLAADGLTTIDVAILLLFSLSLPWYALGFWNGAIGFALLALARDPVATLMPAARRVAPGRRLGSRTAIVMPIHNERPERVFRHLETMARSLETSGEAHAFDLVVLSDTRDPEIAREEERRFALWRGRSAWPQRLHYRRRADNAGYKAGNVWEFLDRCGANYDHMLVLDADSLMTGRAIVRAVQIMEANPEIGILQTLVVGLPNPSAFARIFQFGMRHGLRAYTAGAAWWQGDCGSYWGHNAVIRIAPFMAHCRLPHLPGKPPFGGQIMSHDQVEAQLMRRAGWQVRVLPEEWGSFEENPPALTEFLRRDLRWCQGNWQYLKLLGMPGLHPMGRVALLLAVLMYVTGPVWVTITLLALLAAVLGGSLPVLVMPVIAPVPTGPLAAEAWVFLAVMLGIALAPKLAGIAQVLVSPALRRANGGGLGVLRSFALEYAFSLVLAPVMAVAETVMLVKMLLGRTTTWDAQLRDNHTVPLGVALAGLWAQLTLAALTLAVILWAVPGQLGWMLLMVVALVLAVPLACLSARTDLGIALARRGICTVPEELAPPEEVVEAGHLRWLPHPPVAVPPRGGRSERAASAAPSVD